MSDQFTTLSMSSVSRSLSFTPIKRTYH